MESTCARKEYEKHEKGREKRPSENGPEKFPVE